MKVLIVPSWYPTEENPISGVFFQEQSLALKKNSRDVIVAYPEIRSLKSFDLFQTKSGFNYGLEKGLKTYRYRGYNILPGVKGHIRKKYSKFLEYLFVKILKEQGRPDIIHAHSILFGGWAASKIAKKYKIPFVITEHSSYYVRGLIKDYYKPYVKESLENADRIIAVGPSLQRGIKEYTEKDIIIIPNIVDTTMFKYKLIKKKKENFRFFSLALLTSTKGMDTLLYAFSKLVQKSSRVELLIGGDGPEKKNLELLAQKLQIDKNVKFLGELSRSETITEMQNCDSFVMASRFETFGVVYIEALACGKPIIATKCGGPELIVNEKNGLLVNVDDIDGLTSAMEVIINNYSDYSPTEIVNDCYSRFSENSVSKQLINIYSPLIK